MLHLLSCANLIQAVIALMEMGFDEKEVVDALRVNNNQQNAAVSTMSFLFFIAIIVCSTDSFHH